MASVRKHRGKWQVQVRRKGLVASKSFMMKADAVQWGREQELHQDRQQLQTRGVLEGSLGELVERYLREVTPLKKGSRDESCVLKAFLREPICAKGLSELQPRDLSNYRDQRLRKVKASTVRRQWNTLRHLLAWGGLDKELQSTNIRAPEASVERRLQPGELEALVSAAHETQNPWVLPCVLLALETGLRRGELLNLQWGDVAQGTLRVKEGKTGYGRTVVLTEGAQEILRSLDRSQSRVFPMTANALRQAWVRLKVRAGIKIRFHDLRHEAISHFFEMGLTIPEVASQSGHRDLSVLSRYSHPHLDHIKQKFASGQR